MQNLQQGTHWIIDGPASRDQSLSVYMYIRSVPHHRDIPSRPDKDLPSSGYCANARNANGPACMSAHIACTPALPWPPAIPTKHSRISGTSARDCLTIELQQRWA
jgi:hypothetical protein